MYEDKTLICKECGREFIWTAGEQEFYAEKGFANEPKRCKECREVRKKDGRPVREMYDALCAECGKPCVVPFKPTGDRPVYCRECFTKMQSTRY
ncbi:zinc-ribbon domain containing protein [Desulfosporosinus sp. PR]|uniref:zinc-ribbon domain containing protein n=1 Tax=Candidatus Desulfosporosinus nitrosoreducens TaxID=3401928 RepID=UPI0027F1D0D4|nr:zinc-ribbon domain containing protein [Desulfosporosinus sp. PR]MDQ7093587.1 zinc-ribbon domain containing protein [Desulfosporosinus sp. PR]